jgi:hypothetical protein
MLEHWHLLQSSFLDKSEEGTRYLGEILTNIVSDKAQFAIFFEKVLEGELYQLHEGYFVHLPLSLIDDGEYQGNVEISWNNFDNQEHVGVVRLDKFYLYVKLAAVFHARHVDHSFDPWEGFRRLDDMQKQYYPYPNA